MVREVALRRSRPSHNGTSNWQVWPVHRNWLSLNGVVLPCARHVCRLIGSRVCAWLAGQSLAAGSLQRDNTTETQGHDWRVRADASQVNKCQLQAHPRAVRTAQRHRSSQRYAAAYQSDSHQAAVVARAHPSIQGTCFRKRPKACYSCGLR